MRWRQLKKALREGSIILFIGEGGLSERPPWVPRVQTPVLQYHFNWKVLSAAAGISWRNFYLRLYRGTTARPKCWIS